MDRMQAGVAEDAAVNRLIGRFQSGDERAFTELYRLYYDRVFGYLRVAFKSSHEAEDVTQEVFMAVFEALPAYELRGKPFDAWLFTIVRRLAIRELRRQGQVEAMDPAEIDNHRERQQAAAADLGDDALDALSWIKGSEMGVLVERLPLPQRQVLFLRYRLDLPPREIAEVLNTTPNHVSVLHYRALNFLRERFTAFADRPEPKEPESENADRSSMRAPKKHSRVLRNRRYAL